MGKIKMIVYSMLVSIFISILILIVISRKIKPVVYEIVTFEVEKMESTIVNKAINSIVDADYDINRLFVAQKSANDEIQVIDFDSNQVNKFLNIITMQIQNDLKMFDDGVVENFIINEKLLFADKEFNSKKGVIIGIPLFSAFKDTLFSNIGPKIPMKIYFLGDVNSNISTKITEYGINNALVEIGVNVEINAKILFPFSSDKLKITTSVPVAIKMIQGKIPNYYGNGFIKESVFYSLPSE